MIRPSRLIGMRLLRWLSSVFSSGGAFRDGARRQGLSCDDLAVQCRQGETERTEAEAALRESEDHYRHMVELNPQIPWTAGKDGAVETFSERWVGLTGLSREDTIGWGWSRAVHPDDLGGVLRGWREKLGSGAPFDMEFRIRLAGGDYRWMRSRAFPRHGPAGDILRWYGALEDIHDRKLAEEALRASERRYRFLADAIPQIVWTATPEGDVDFINARLADHLGTGESRAHLGWDWGNLLHPNDLSHTLAAWEEARRQCRPYEVEYRLRRRDGLYRWHLVRALPMCDASGRVVKWFGSTTDIHDRKVQSEALEAARAEAERANLAKSKFLAAASHDLRQPVQSMILFAQVLAGKLRGHPAAPILDKLMMAQESFKSLLDSLLDLSKLDAGLVHPEIQAVEVSELLEEMAAACHLRAAEKGLVFKLRICHAWADTDPTLLRRILSNFIDNALKYTRQGGIRLSCRRQGGRLRFDVIDSGVGIAAEHLHTIFDEFVQVGETGGEQRQGMGLGLSTVKRLVDLLGYELRVRSHPGRGSGFTVFVPVIQPKLHQTEVPHPGRQADTHKRILVVDDEAPILEGMRVLLEGWGYEPVTATTMDGALASLVSAGPPVAMVADLRLGAGVTGPDVIGAVRSRLGADLPALLLTGDTAVRSGQGFQVLHKPVSPDYLRRTLATLCA